MIVMDEKIIALWFLPTTETQDWLAALQWETDDGMKAGKGNIKLTYRFRYYSGKQTGDPFLDDDKKNWYEGLIGGETKEHAIETVRIIGRKMAVLSGNKLEEILNTGDYDKFMKEFMKKPFAHMKKVEAEA